MSSPPPKFEMIVPHLRLFDKENLKNIDMAFRNLLGKGKLKKSAKTVARWERMMYNYPVKIRA